MSNCRASDLYPMVAIQDRYQGTYSGGPWLAVRNARAEIEGITRAAWVIESGPGGCDFEAAGFWANPPDWIAVGGSPNEAVANLKRLAS